MTSFCLKTFKINQCFPNYHSAFNSACYQLVKRSSAGRKVGFSQFHLRKMGTSQPVTEALEALHLQTPTSTPPKFPDFYPEYNPLDIYRAHLASSLSDVTGVAAGNIYPCLQWTQSLAKGDMVLPVPALRVKGGKPTDLAQAWAKEFPHSPLIEKPVADGVYLQFFFKPGAITQYVVPEILKRQQKYGQNPLLGLKDAQDPSKGRKRMVVEFSSPNIAKPFHAGHLRSTIIGGFLSNLYEGAGWDVVRLNYLGDWGKQYGLLALAFERYGDEAALDADPISHLFELYVKINKELEAEKEEIERLEQVGKDASKIKDEGLDEQARRYFKAMCDNDPKAIQTWKRFRELSITRYEKSYARLNIRFDEYSGESKVSPESMANVEKELEAKGLSEPSAGAVIMDFTKHVPGKLGKSLGKALLRKRDGTSLYLTRDIGGLLERSAKYNFDQMIYVIGSDQDTHVKQFFKIIELTGHKELHAKISHVSFGRVHGMSTRKGTVVFLDDILRDVGDKMHEVMKKNEAKYQQVVDPEKTADILGISSVMVQDMGGKIINGYQFNMDAMTSFEGDTGPYLQYAHARLCSIVRKVDPDATLDLSSAQTELLVEPHAVDLVRLIARYPDTIQGTLKSHEPITVLTYLFRMTHALSSSYDVLKVAGSEPELMKARLALYTAARIVLDNGMRLLGLTPVDRM